MEISSRTITGTLLFLAIIASSVFMVMRKNGFNKYIPLYQFNQDCKTDTKELDIQQLNKTTVDDETVAKILVARPVILPEDNVCPRDNRKLPFCRSRPIVSKKFNVSYDLHSFDELVGLHGKDLSDGGHFRPAKCRARQVVAIVIPYRDREMNLKMFLNNLHPFLKNQDVEYTMFVVEQLPGTKFNRGMLKNIGFFEARKLCRFDCVFFHDIDMVPDDRGNVYQCGPQPRQHSRNLARWQHKTPFYESFGGVICMKPSQFIKVNGYTNTYFEWGAEDNELGNRVLYHKMEKSHYPFSISTYQEFNHSVSKKYEFGNKWYNNWKERTKGDGLTTLFYKFVGVIQKPLFTHIYVEINSTVVKNAYKGQVVMAGESDKPVNMKQFYETRKNTFSKMKEAAG